MGVNQDATLEPVAYLSVAKTLREQIARGDFAEGKRLPTEIELSQTYKLSRQTVRRAMQDLVSEGLIYRVRGRGTFATGVTPGNRYLRSFGSIEDLLAISLDSTTETIEPLTRRAEVDTASRLRLDSDEVMIGLIRRAHQGVPFAFIRVAVSVQIGIKLLEEGVLATSGDVTTRPAISVVDRIAPISGAHQSITAVTLPEPQASMIELEPGAPALRIDRLYYDAQSQPVELAISYCNPDRYTYRIELNRGDRKSGGG